MNLRNFKISLYQAIESPEISTTFFQKHVNVLESFGVTGISSAKNTWQNKPTVWLFVLFNEDDEMIGGVRLDIKSGFKMPLESALENYPGVMQLASQYELDFGVAELCGLWIEKEYRKANLANALIKAAIATAPNIGVNYILGFANEHSLKTTVRLGFSQVAQVENSGVFYYPDGRYKSMLIELDAINCQTDEQKDLETIKLLREDLKFIDVVSSEEGLSMVHYNLEAESIRIKKMAVQLKSKLVA